MVKRNSLDQNKLVVEDIKQVWVGGASAKAAVRIMRQSQW
jgi:hypothetical protein